MATGTKEQIGGGFIPVYDRVLASVLLALDVPLQTDLVDGGGVAPVQNVYSEQSPARVNGRRVLGKTSILFAPHTRDGKTRTRDIIAAWEQVAEKVEGDARTQAFDELNAIADQIADGSGLATEGERRNLAAKQQFWLPLAIAQAVRVALGHHREVEALLLDPTAVAPRAQVKRARGWHFKPIAPSQL